MKLRLGEAFTKLLNEFPGARSESFAQHPVADFIRNDLNHSVRATFDLSERYIVKSSPGKGVWVEVPWVAIMDELVCTTPQTGYYPVFLFSPDGEQFALSLNQGVTANPSIPGLRSQAQSYLNAIQKKPAGFSSGPLALGATGPRAKIYEAASIIAKTYSRDFDEAVVKQDFDELLKLYQNMVEHACDVLDVEHSTFLNDSATEEDLRKKRMHLRIDRSSSLVKKVKSARGYECEVCQLNFEDKYGELGKGFIEAHHRTPLAELAKHYDVVKYDSEFTGFAVLCSNCHRMVHRLMKQDASCDPIEKLRQLINTKQSN